MRERVLGSRWVWWLAALEAVVVVMLIAPADFAGNDYEREAAPAVAALLDGDVERFVALSPAYGGSLVLRAPVLMATGGLGGDATAAYRAGVLVCLLALAALGVALALRMARRGRARRACLVTLALCAANPLVMLAITRGHAEEMLAAALAVGALLAAAPGRRWALAAVLLGLAVASKPWALLAVGPVLVALPGRRLPALLLSGAVGAAVTAPLLLAGSTDTLVQGASQTGSTFKPWQIFWFFGSTPFVDYTGAVNADYRSGPQWLSGLTHPLIVALTVPLSLLWARRRPLRTGEELLLLLALLFGLRCVLDPWNNAYYALPFVLALLGWEALQRPHRPPYAAIGASAATYVTFQLLPGLLHPDVESVVYLAWTLPLLAWLAREAFWPAGARDRAPRRRRPEARATPAPAA